MSRIIKPDAKENREAEFLVAPNTTGDVDNSGFQGFESMWQGGSSEAAALAALKARELEIEQKAEEVIRQAQAQASEIERQAYEKGFGEGKQEGLKVAAEKAREIERLLAAIENERATLYGRYEQDVIGLVMAMVEKLVNHEVSVNPRVILACLKKSLTYVIENSIVKVHLNSIDFARIKEVGIDDPELLEGFNQLELIEDQAISEGGCMLETEFGEVDATLENRKEVLQGAIDQFFMQSLAEG